MKIKLNKMLLLRSLTIICFLSMMAFTAPHKYYLSLTQINYVEETESLQITSELFTDDLEKVLRNRYSEAVNLVEGSTSQTSKLYISQYLEQKLILKLDGKQISPKFLGIEYQDDKIVCYLECENIAKFNVLEVSNKVLFDMFAKQQNIVKLKVKNIEKSLLLIKNKQTGMIRI